MLWVAKGSNQVIAGLLSTKGCGFKIRLRSFLFFLPNGLRESPLAVNVQKKVFLKTF
jgi:hypothetical protein